MQTSFAISQLTLVILISLLSGCATSGPSDPTAAPTWMITQTGNIHVAATLVECLGEIYCGMTLPTSIEPGHFAVNASANNATLVASWQAGLSVPEKWAVSVALSDGGIWGMASGASPLKVDLSDPLIAGTYSIEVSPDQIYVGPLNATIHWEVRYEISAA